VERSDTHHASAQGLLMGFASLYPSYHSTSSICRKSFSRESNSTGTPSS
jgi:hypothetical protein